MTVLIRLSGLENEKNQTKGQYKLLQTSNPRYLLKRNLCNKITPPMERATKLHPLWNAFFFTSPRGCFFGFTFFPFFTFPRWCFWIQFCSILLGGDFELRVKKKMASPRGYFWIIIFEDKKGLPWRLFLYLDILEGKASPRMCFWKKMSLRSNLKKKKKKLTKSKIWIQKDL